MSSDIKYNTFDCVSFVYVYDKHANHIRECAHALNEWRRHRIEMFKFVMNKGELSYV